MIKIAILGDIGSGKSFIAKLFGFPVFNADNEVKKIYNEDKSCYKKLKRAIPKHIISFPINKREVTKSILSNQKNLKKIIKIVHPIVRVKMNKFIDKNKKKKIVVFDIPLLLENKINKKNDVLIFVKSKRSEILKRLKNRESFNKKLLNEFKNIQLPLDYKKKKSTFIIKNNFKKKSVRKDIKNILKNFR